MSKQSRSARGQIVNFDLLAIKQQLATQPISVGVNQRRKFIDEKDGIKSKESYVDPPVSIESEIPSALAVAADAVKESAKAAEKPLPKKS